MNNVDDYTDNASPCFAVGSDGIHENVILGVESVSDVDPFQTSFLNLRGEEGEEATVPGISTLFRSQSVAYEDHDPSYKPVSSAPRSSFGFERDSPPTVLTPRCCTCCKYPHFPDNEECFHCLKMTYDDDKCRTINETGSNVGRQCGYKPIEDNQRCLKHNEEFIDVVRSSDEEESSGNEDDDDSIVVTDHSSDGECVSSDECETTVE